MATQKLRPGQAGGLARAKAFTNAYQRAAQKARTRESLSAAGRKGYLAVVQQYGAEYATDRSADWRRKHPTELERIVMGWVDELGEAYSPEHKLAPRLYVDLFLERRGLAIECDGNGWHSNSGPHHEDREARDRTKDQRIRALGHRVLRLAEADIRSGAARRQLGEFLQK